MTKVPQLSRNVSVADFYCLDVNRLRRLLTPQDRSSIRIEMDLNGQTAEAALKFVTIPNNLGGTRTRAICPACKRRCTKLYVLYHGLRVGCPRCLHRHVYRKNHDRVSHNGRWAKALAEFRGKILRPYLHRRKAAALEQKLLRDLGITRKENGPPECSLILRS